MAHSPAQQERKLVASGGRFVAIGAPLVVVGVVIALLLDGTALGIGVAIAVWGRSRSWSASRYALGRRQRRDRQHKPWA